MKRTWRWGAACVSLAMVGGAAQAARADGGHGVDCRVRKCVAITFDDGPGAYTDKLLASLAAANARATFFVLGEVAAERPSALRRIAAAGHEIGDHSWDHPELPRLSDERVRTEISRTADLVEKLTGTRPELMRPPYGEVSSRVVGILRSHGWPIIQWSVDPEDWKDRNADTVYRRVIAGTHPGSIVLLHDIHASTVAAVPRILATLAARGYTFVTVSQLYNRPLSAGEQYFDRVDAYVGAPAKPAAIKSDAEDG